jgi:predicted DNA-binding helix-hairpin-helix protein
MVCSNIKLTGPAESIGIVTRTIRERNQWHSGIDVQRKLEIPAGAAKYDASCASSGTEKRIPATARASARPRPASTASREDLLRVPGFGARAVDRIIATHRLTSIRLADLARLHIPQKKALPFIVLSDHRPSAHLLDSAGLAERFKPKAMQLGFGF